MVTYWEYSMTNYCNWYKISKNHYLPESPNDVFEPNNYYLPESPDDVFELKNDWYQLEHMDGLPDSPNGREQIINYTRHYYDIY